jgi:hypothetical protein
MKISINDETDGLLTILGVSIKLCFKTPNGLGIQSLVDVLSKAEHECTRR